MTVRIINILFQVYFFVMVGRVVLSWVRASGQTISPRVEEAVHTATEPVFAPARRVYNYCLGLTNLDRRGLPVDLSPLLAFIAVGLIHRLVLTLLA